MTTIEMLNFNPNNDIADRLSEAPAGATKFRALRQAKDDSHAILRPIIEQRMDLESERNGYLLRIKQLTDPRGASGYDLDSNAIQVVDVQRKLNAVNAERARLAAVYEDRSARWQAACTIDQMIEAYLREGVPQGCVLVDYEPPEVKLKKGENLIDAVEGIRRYGREHAANLNRIRTALHLAADRKAAMRLQIDAMCAASEPDASRSIALADPIEFATEFRRIDVLNGAGQQSVGHVALADTWNALAWLFPDAMIAALDRLIDSEASDKDALSDAQRQEMEATISADLLANDRVEVAMIEAAAAQGSTIGHRPDVSPLALLSVELITAPERPASKVVPAFIKQLMG